MMHELIKAQIMTCIDEIGSLKKRRHNYKEAIKIDCPRRNNSNGATL